MNIIKRSAGTYPEPWTGWHVGGERLSFGRNGSGNYVLSALPKARYRTFQVGRFVLSLGMPF